MLTDFDIFFSGEIFGIKNLIHHKTSLHYIVIYHYLLCMFQIFSDINISQGSVAKFVRLGGKLNDTLVENRMITLLIVYNYTASHWPCVAEFSGLSTYVLTA